MQILAVYPEEPELAVFEKMPPLGMLWVAGTLRRAGYEIEFLDQQIDERDPGAVAQEGCPRLLLLGGTSHSRFASFEAARRVKRTSPETRVVYGGPHASFTAEDTLTHVPEIDIIVHGEGEETSAELAEWSIRGEGRWEDLEAIRGISYRLGGRIARTPPRPAIADLDALGPPDRSLVPMDRYRMQMDYLDLPGTSIMTARGCPIMCSFCSAAAMFGKTYRARDPQAVVDEVEELITRHRAKGIKIFDSTFTLNRHHVERFCDELQRRGIRVPWECEIRVGSVDRPLLEKMREAGCYYVDVGVESGSQRVLDECVRKRISIAKAEELLRWTREMGLLTKVFFTSGHPGETYAEGRETLRFIRRNRRSIRLQAYQAGIKIYPGTYVEEFAREHDLLPDGFRWSAPYENRDNRALMRAVDNVPLLLQPGLGLAELRRLRLQFIAMRIASVRFVLEKLKAIVRSRAFFDYLRIVSRGAKDKPRGRRGSRLG